MAQLPAQQNPIITGWLRNYTGITGRHYLAGNPTPIVDAVLANVQSVKYSTSWVYVDANGIPAYITGPFLDGNPSLATEQTGFFKLPLNPVQNTGTATATTGGNIGAFINGVALFDFRDGVGWNSTTQTLCGGPGNPPCPGGPGVLTNWSRDAVLAEKDGFDCAKAHPAGGNYHHHQNPSAFNLDLLEISDICDMYPADGLYAIDSTQHSPLIGFAYDGFPIYGAYGYENTNGTGDIVRIKSSYQLRNITLRTHSPTGVNVPDGPPVNATYPLGYFREDYEYIVHSSPDYLDEHNGRFCVTPEYPNGIYCYFATVDENWNSAYPYAVGPTFYGVKSGSKVTTITETVTTYNGPVLTATAAVTPNNCTGPATGAITLTPAGGNPPYTYNWGNGITTKDRTGLALGSYTVSITDGVGQTATLTATVTPSPNDTTQVAMNTCDPNQTGVTYTALVNQNGCDSIIVTTTTLLPVNLLVENNALPGGIYRSLGPLTSHTTTVATGLDVQFVSDTTVEMTHDFVVDSGAVFEARIEVCMPNLGSGPIAFETKKKLVDVTVDGSNMAGYEAGNIHLQIMALPQSELVIVRSKALLRNTLHLQLTNAAGEVVMEKDFYQGSTICHFQTETLYEGAYFLKVNDGDQEKTFEVAVER